MHEACYPRLLVGLCGDDVEYTSIVSQWLESKFSFLASDYLNDFEEIRHYLDPEQPLLVGNVTTEQQADEIRNRGGFILHVSPDASSFSLFRTVPVSDTDFVFCHLPAELSYFQRLNGIIMAMKENLIDLLTDQEREQLIAVHADEIQTADTPEERRTAWDNMQTLINGRSTQQIHRMETFLSPSPN